MPTIVVVRHCDVAGDNPVEPSCLGMGIDPETGNDIGRQPGDIGQPWNHSEWRST